MCGPSRLIASPPNRLSLYCGRIESGIIITARIDNNPVDIVAYTHTIFAVIRRFFNFGYAISRYTCASVSNPLIASSECPNPTTISTTGNCVQNVPCSHPRLSSFIVKFDGNGGGGNGAPPRINSVIPHQINMQTTITVVICIMCSACPEDS